MTININGEWANIYYGGSCKLHDFVQLFASIWLVRLEFNVICALDPIQNGYTTNK